VEEERPMLERGSLEESPVCNDDFHTSLILAILFSQSHSFRTKILVSKRTRYSPKYSYSSRRIAVLRCLAFMYTAKPGFLYSYMRSYAHVQYIRIKRNFFIKFEVNNFKIKLLKRENKFSATFF